MKDIIKEFDCKINRFKLNLIRELKLKLRKNVCLVYSNNKDQNDPWNKFLTNRPDEIIEFKSREIRAVISAFLPTTLGMVVELVTNLFPEKRLHYLYDHNLKYRKVLKKIKNVHLNGAVCNESDRYLFLSKVNGILKYCSRNLMLKKFKQVDCLRMGIHNEHIYALSENFTVTCLDIDLNEKRVFQLKFGQSIPRSFNRFEVSHGALVLSFKQPKTIFKFNGRGKLICKYRKRYGLLKDVFSTQNGMISHHFYRNKHILLFVTHTGEIYRKECFTSSDFQFSFFNEKLFVIRDKTCLEIY